jgi:hypothetical protein
MWFKAEAAIIVFSLLASVPFLDQAFHVDEPNFLALARHASPNPLMLYDFSINWLGTDERAFDVLSNPPLVPGTWLWSRTSRKGGSGFFDWHSGPSSSWPCSERGVSAGALPDLEEPCGRSAGAP